jgi:hypothetical protein
MIHGEPGSGKIVGMRVLAEKLERLTDLTVVPINHPQSNLADFYREIGDIQVWNSGRKTAGAASGRCATGGCRTCKARASAQSY